MNLKRHHVLYSLLALSLILALLVFMTPNVPKGIETPSETKMVENVTPEATATNTPKAFQFEVVTTEGQHEKGLGGRASIPEDYGMLFVFSKPDLYGFWMKDMLTPIDMIWLSDSGTILGIEDTVLPSTYPKAFYPPKPVRYVLETRAGESHRKGWGIGTKITLPLPYGS